MKTQTLTPYPLLILLIFLISTLSFSHSYSPPESFAIDCGSPSRLSRDSLGRSWTGDSENPRFRLVENNKSSSFSAEIQPTNRVPCFTARVSQSSFTYQFSFSSRNPIFIRLHFYPDRYGTFDPSKAFFEVQANGFTLLSNFSPILTADYLKEESFMREYIIYPQDKNLNLTFIPSRSSSESFVFINGIEVVSVPENLYYGSDGTLGFNFIGNEANPYRLSNDTALELAYRLNIGGGFISAVNDTGMFREWKMDDQFYNVIGALPEGLGVDLKYNNFPNYTAPENVYKTARTMGNNGTQNYEYNLTWNLPVDSGFTYWVRLHFCEFQSEVQIIGDREFIIYIYNQTAEEQADVIVWSGGHGVPVYRDYTVIVSKENKKPNLSIALHPRPVKFTRYSDAILNGVEVFKLSKFGGSLAAPNPDPLPTNPSDQDTRNHRAPNKKGGLTGLIAGISAGVVSVLVISLVLGFLFFRRKSTKDTVSYVSVKSGSSGESVSLPADLCRHFSIADIRKYTKDFDKDFIIGHGGFGDVYKGRIDGVDSAVAIKRLNPGSKQGAREFLTEIGLLSQLRHVHLVPLIGYSNDEQEMILVYEYMSHGTLRDHLYKSENPPLSWKQRLQICIGAAKGLHYLHAGAKRMIIHRDVKSTNILLDDKFVAKVSDFGLSKMNPDNTTNTHISTAVKGSFGYLDPEYYRRQQLTEKSDVYSFGVVLFEVLCARPALDKSLERQQISLAAWARKCYDNGTINRIVDPYLAGKIAPECLKKFVEIAMSCLDDEGIQRPSMNDLVWNLEFTLQLQDSATVGSEKIGDDSKEFEDSNALLFHSDSQVFDSDDIHVSSSDGIITASKSGTSFTTSSGSSEDKMSSGAVFSEIMNPMARPSEMLRERDKRSLLRAMNKENSGSSKSEKSLISTDTKAGELFAAELLEDYAKTNRDDEDEDSGDEDQVLS